MSSSFPSGHALTSAAVYLTLGALLMRIAEGRLAKYYCIAIAMFVTFLVGLSRVFLGVHYPSDVIAGWLIGMSWALLCWAVERTLERRAGLKREKDEQPRNSRTARAQSARVRIRRRQYGHSGSRAHIRGCGCCSGSTRLPLR